MTRTINVLSQQLPVWYFVTGVFIAPREKLIEWVHNIGANPYKYRLQKINCVDIDNEHRLRCCSRVGRPCLQMSHRRLVETLSFVFLLYKYFGQTA